MKILIPKKLLILHCQWEPHNIACIHVSIAMPFSAHPLVKKNVFDLDIVVKNRLKWGLVIGLESNNVCHNRAYFHNRYGLTQLLLISPQHFDHCDDVYLCQ